MIGSLKGCLLSKQAPVVVVECAGVGYEVETPMSTFLDLPDPGTEVFLLTHLLVRDDAHTLFGFGSSDEKALFRMLLKVNGVGAKMALAILSGMSVNDFTRCVQFEDAAMLVKIPGVGKKTAERLIVEMRDRVESAGETTGTRSAVTRSDARSEAGDALIALGYRPAEVTKLLASLDVDNLSAEDIIRQALKQAVK
jgi:Holliday junction DNA helicase RuvA